MPHWPQDERREIARTDDLHLSVLRNDGVTLGTLTWVWSVVVDAELYVRAYSGTNSRCYGAALKQRAGRITAAGMARDVTFEPVPDGDLQDRIDDAYRAKYAGSPYLNDMLGPRARAATMRVSPGNTA